MLDRLELLNGVDRSEVFPDVVPRNASSLLLIQRPDDQSEAHYKVLMGCRHQNHTFLPDVFVFPGGAVDHADYEMAKSCPPHFHEWVAQYATLKQDDTDHTPGVFGAGLVMAALRETFEETGIDLVGNIKNAAPDRHVHEWEKLLRNVVLLSRAITPPGRPKRFDTRFFVLEMEDCSSTVEDSDELLNLQWVSYHQALDLNLHPITRVILEDLNDYVKDVLTETRQDLMRQPQSVAFYQMVDQRFQCEWVEMKSYT